MIESKGEGVLLGKKSRTYAWVDKTTRRSKPQSMRDGRRELNFPRSVIPSEGDVQFSLGAFFWYFRCLILWFWKWRRMKGEEGRQANGKEGESN